ncbi:MAG: HPF/RaiA family ribosome-associated protein [Azonexus sp.]|nr:HPF/RaiA family ribosome-associated protein [Azonexus sp.]
MHVQIQVKGLSKATQLRRFASRKLEAALSRFSHVIQDVNVRINDINGPDRGGVDKLCRVVLRFKDNSIIVIEELGSEVLQVIDRVADRLHQIVSRQLSHLVKVDQHGIRQSKLLAAND